MAFVMDRKEAEKFFNSQRHNCSDVELSRGAVYYPVSFITEILETYKREGVIEELEKIKEVLKEVDNDLAQDNYDNLISFLDSRIERISELKK